MMTSPTTPTTLPTDYLMVGLDGPYIKMVPFQLILDGTPQQCTQGLCPAYLLASNGASYYTPLTQYSSVLNLTQSIVQAAWKASTPVSAVTARCGVSFVSCNRGYGISFFAIRGNLDLSAVKGTMV